MSQIQLEKQAVIERSIDVVRAHFLDFDHHITNDVHKSVRYTVLARGRQTRVRSRFSVLGLPKQDEILIYADHRGSVVQEFVQGDFAGGTLKVHFDAETPTRTRLRAVFDVPARGINRLMKPIVRSVISRIADQALEEDRRDLEEGGYQPSDPAALVATRT
jgi:hypothetical protein